MRTINRTFVGERYTHPLQRTLFKAELAGPETTALLTNLGVTIRQPRGRITFRRDPDGTTWHEIGRILIHKNQTIEVQPRQGLTEYEMNALRGSISEAFTSDMYTWRFRPYGHAYVYDSSICLPN